VLRVRREERETTAALGALTDYRPHASCNRIPSELQADPLSGSTEGSWNASRSPRTTQGRLDPAGKPWPGNRRNHGCDCVWPGRSARGGAQAILRAVAGLPSPRQSAARWGSRACAEGGRVWRGADTGEDYAIA